MTTKAQEANGKTYRRVRNTVSAIADSLNSSYWLGTKQAVVVEDEIDNIRKYRELIEIRKNQIAELEEQIIFLEFHVEMGHLEDWVEYDNEQYAKATW